MVAETPLILTPQQARVLRLKLQGFTAQETAERLGIAHGTVLRYMTDIKAATGFHGPGWAFRLLYAYHEATGNLP